MTARELEVANLLAAGNKLPEIAAVLGLSTETVKTHVTNIKRKLGARNHVDVAVWYVTKGNKHARR